MTDTTGRAPAEKRSVVLLKKSILPVSLIGAGAILSSRKPGKNLQSWLRDRVGNIYECHIDDYIQYAPVAMMYTADIAGVKSRNHDLNGRETVFHHLHQQNCSSIHSCNPRQKMQRICCII